MGLETLLIAKPGLTRAIGWGFIVVFGIGAALFGWKYFSYPASGPEPLTVAEAIARLDAADSDADVWLTLTDFDRSRAHPVEAGETSSIALVHSDRVLVVSFNPGELEDEPSGELGRSSPRRVAYLRTLTPELFPEGRVVYGMTTWGGPQNMLAGVVLMAGFMAFGPVFLLLGWKARRDAERVRREGFDWIDSTTELRLLGGGFLLILALLAIWMPAEALGLSLVVVPPALLLLWAPRWLITGCDDAAKAALSLATGIPWSPPERRSLLQWWRDRQAPKGSRG